MRDFQLPGRSPVLGLNGAVATSHPLASAVALEMLKAGGHAMDAAIAASAVLTVVEPGMTGIGGDNFTIVAEAGGPVRAYNGSGRAPAGLDAEAVRAAHRTMPRYSAHSITIPGAVEAWCRLHETYGRLPLDRLMAPAVAFARDGYAMHQRVAFDWTAQVEKLGRDPHAAAVMLPGGTAPRAGSVHRQPALAATLERIGREGRDAFYLGSVAEDMVNRLKELGGSHTLDDFAEAEGEWVEPISTTYRGHELLECPPNGQGLVPLIMLNILSDYDLGSLDPLGAERIHLFIEAAKLAYGERDSRIADPRMSDVPVETLLSADHADQLRRSIDREKAGPTPPSSMPASEDTIYLCVVDRDGNAVSFINSIFENFGSGLMAPSSGVMFHNRGFSFRLDPDHANTLAPKKRPLHTIIPAMLIKDGAAVVPFGVMGAHFQPFGQSWMLSNMLDHGMDIQEAQDLARAFGYAGEVTLERGIAPDVAARLAELGHQVSVAPTPHGGSQGIFIDRESGVLSAGSDPRKDGCALAY
ncbi:gamma-glutamyltransferase [Paracoccus sp. TK19116]|uniref:Glutathione hydrolase proenzyme n=1 Tax=Paracoccus albicereus TaxID=2922394 RepID=A0ABT1MXM8_9RHOB|nr:gamma-glutamyltransferase [Paracoccus albicereus]MCQ0972093.1 gamma-glutamyltransferase [Paracoccus albicereus]